MTADERKKIYAALAAPFSEECIERTNGRLTGKGYSTTGIKAQFIINRLNEVVGIGGWRTHRDISVTETTTSTGRKAFEAVCDLALELGHWVDGKFEVWAEVLSDGGHIATSIGDAKKASFSNALKRAAAQFGCGKAAYEGTLDDDNIPVDPQAPARPVSTQPRPASPPPARLQPALAAVRVAQPQEAAVDPAQVQNRNRLTSKQLSAIWSLSRKAGYQQAEFRGWVKQRFGVMPEFLDRNAASKLIGQLSAPKPNGHAPAAPELAAPAVEG